MTLTPRNHDLLSSDRVPGLWHLNIWLCNLQIVILHLPCQVNGGGGGGKGIKHYCLDLWSFHASAATSVVQASVDMHPAKAHHFLTLWRQVIIQQTISIFAAWFHVHSRRLCKALMEPVQMGKSCSDSPKWREFHTWYRAQQYTYKYVAGERTLGYHRKGMINHNLHGPTGKYCSVLPKEQNYFHNTMVTNKVGCFLLTLIVNL